MCRFNHAAAPAIDARGFDQFEDLSWFTDELPMDNVPAPTQPVFSHPIPPNEQIINDTDAMDLYAMFKEEEEEEKEAPIPAKFSMDPTQQAPLLPANANQFGVLASNGQQMVFPQLTGPIPGMFTTQKPVQRSSSDSSTASVEQLLALQNAANAGSIMNPMVNSIQAQLIQQLQMAQALGAATGGKSATAASQGLGVQDDSVEKMKQKRRESAQRSRQRKNCYMRQLEYENRALKEEVVKLTAALTKVQRALASGCVNPAHGGTSFGNSPQASSAGITELSGPCQPSVPLQGAL